MKYERTRNKMGDTWEEKKLNGIKRGEYQRRGKEKKRLKTCKEKENNKVEREKKKREEKPYSSSSYSFL